MKSTILQKNVFIVLILFLSIFQSSCGKSDITDNDSGGSTSSLTLSKLSIYPNLGVVAGGDIEFEAMGVEKTDEIVFVCTRDSKISYTVSPFSIKNENVVVSLDPKMTSEIYRVIVKRGNTKKEVGVVNFTIHPSANIPDKSGMNLKGRVTANGTPLANVVVSDGNEVTTTNADGIYYLKSSLKYNYVFISVPANYAVDQHKQSPNFYQTLARTTTHVQEHNFELVSKINDHHVFIALADWHLAGKDDDILQYEKNCVPDINKEAQAYIQKGIPVYGITLGDLSWDNYWFSNNFALPQYLEKMNELNFPVYNCMGNHDNDPYCTNDYIAEEPYRKYVGPTYYSFNVGKSHVVVLDNIQYINTGGSYGIIGERNFSKSITSEEMDWLRKDLRYITDKDAPLFICMHAPLGANPTIDANGIQKNIVQLSNGQELINACADFSNVHILSGHTHVNYNVIFQPNIFEHNTASLCATWWYTGKTGIANNHICGDGSVGGYGVYEIKGNEVTWYYKSVGFDKSYQFRTLDLNNVLITAAKYAPTSTDEKLAPYIANYGKANLNNQVLINVFNYDPEWKISVQENGVNLVVNRIYTRDPLHLISNETFKLNLNKVPKDDETWDSGHFFIVTAKTPFSTLTITVTDRFGNVYQETMTRPKAFNTSMK